jgi:hypothetical protein
MQRQNSKAHDISNLRNFFNQVASELEKEAFRRELEENGGLAPKVLKCDEDEPKGLINSFLLMPFKMFCSALGAAKLVGEYCKETLNAVFGKSCIEISKVSSSACEMLVFRGRQIYCWASVGATRQDFQDIFRIYLEFLYSLSTTVLKSSVLVIKTWWNIRMSFYSYLASSLFSMIN